MISLIGLSSAPAHHPAAPLITYETNWVCQAWMRRFGTFPQIRLMACQVAEKREEIRRSVLC